MIRTLLAAALLAAAGSAVAAPPSCEPDLAPPTFVRFATADEKVGLGEIVYAASSVGLVWGYACTTKDAAGVVSWHRVIAGGPWEQFPRDWLAILDAAVRGTKADRDALWVKYANAGEWDARLKPDLDAVWARLPLPPPPTVWKVLADPFRADRKRLVYTVAAGKRGPATTQYVDAGQPCDPVTTITELGGVTFLSVLGNPALVARCSK